MRRSLIYLSQILIVLIYFSISYAWDCFTHAYIAKKAGIKIPEAACMPDIIREDNYDLLGPFHYHDAAPDIVVTPNYIDRFNVTETNIEINGKNYKIKVPHPAGVLYWKIVELYEKMKSLDKSTPDNNLSYEYYLLSIAHYIGDLSQPLHNFPHGDKPASDGNIYQKEGEFNREYHLKFDEAFSLYLNKDPEIGKKVEKSIENIKLESTDELKKHISVIANSSLQIANKCYREKRMPKEEELIKQVSLSISLLKAVILSTK